MSLDAELVPPNRESPAASVQDTPIEPRSDFEVPDASLPLKRVQFLVAKKTDVEFLMQKTERGTLVDQLINYTESPEFAAKLSGGVAIDKAHFIRIMGSVVLGLSIRGKDDSAKGEFSLVAKFNNPEFANELERFGNAQQRFAKAAWATKDLEKIGVEMPSIVAIGESDIDGKTLNWMVQEKTRGLEGKNLPATVQDSEKLWGAVGQAALQVHRLEPVGYGHRFNPKITAFEQTWAEYLAEELKKIDISKIKKELNLSTESKGAIEERLARLESLAERYPIALNHLDLNPNHNIFFDPSTVNQEVAKTCGIIDFDSSAALPGAVFEIACQLNGPQLFGGNCKGVDRLISTMGLERSPDYATFWQDVEAVQTLLLLQTATFAFSAALNDFTRPQVEGIARFLNGLTTSKS